MTARPTLPALLAALLLGVAGCGGGEPTGPTRQPSALRIDGGNQQEGVVGQALSLPLAVTVLDNTNAPLSGVRVSFDVEPGSGSLTPTSATTDASGRAQATWTLGTVAGTARATATVNGVNAATFTATALAGPASRLVASPSEIALGAGDTLSLRAEARDAFGNPSSLLAVAWSTLDPATVTVSATGRVTALAAGNGRIVASASGPGGTLADTVPVVVGVAGSGFCGARTINTLAVGAVLPLVRTTEAAELCVGAAIDGAEYALVATNVGTSFGTARTVDVLALGTTAPPLAATAGVAGAVTARASSGLRVLLGADEAGPDAPRAVDDGGFEHALRQRERRELAPLAAAARATMRPRLDASGGGRAGALAAATAPTIGSLVTFNVQTSSACANADNRTGRVVAVSDRAVIVADTANPTGGYTDAEYQAIAAQFDTLVYPIGTSNFGLPTDINDDGRSVLFYTRAVNQLTPQNAGFVIGGFFFARDLYPKQAGNDLPGCASSNEREMFYLLVPDPSGSVNGNVRAKTDVSRTNLATLAHEYEHLINSSRRLYITPNAATAEEVWLDEALAHSAEDLLYFRVAGRGTRDNLGVQQVANTQANADIFSAYAAQNFGRFYRYLIAPTSSSPYAPNDSLSTRGAGWHFLRYAAGRLGNSDTVFFRQLVNGPGVGITNLAAAVPGGDLAGWIRDWSIAIFADDYVASGLADEYRIPAWNFRSIFPQLRVNGQPLNSYPLSTRTLVSNQPARFTIAGGGSGFARFSVDPTRAALLSVSLNGAAPDPDVRLSVVRVR